MSGTAKKTKKQIQVEWDAFYKNFVASANARMNESESEKRARIKRLEGDFEEWKKYYFAKYCTAPSARFHKKASKRILNNPEFIESRVWARELAKDVVCMMETIYQALTGIKRNIILISNSWDKASDLLEPYRNALEKNERIIDDYGLQKMPGSWAYGDFITTQGVSFLAVGADQSPRGSRNEEVRPDKVIFSDIDTDEDVRNSEIIDKRWNWCERAVMPTRAVDKPFQVVWLGNLIAKDCCVARAMKIADYVDKVNLEDKNGNSSWPEKNSQENIERIKRTISTAAYMAEYMNTPLTQGSVFKEITYGNIPSLNRFRFLVAYGDPSPSNNKTARKNSTKALWLTGVYEGILYIITGFLDRVTNDEFVDWFYAIEDYVGGKTQIYNYIENNSLQNPFYEQVFLPLFFKKGQERGHHIGIIPDTRKKPDKFSRMEGNLEPLNRTNRLIFNEKERGNPHMQRLEEQFLLISPALNSPADGPDAVEGGGFICNNKLLTLSGDTIIIGVQHTNKKRW